MNKNITGRTKARLKRMRKKKLVKEDMEKNQNVIKSLNKSKKGKKYPKYFTKEDIKKFSQDKASLNRLASIENSGELLGEEFSASAIYFKYGRDFLNEAYGKYGIVLKKQIVLNIKNNGEEVNINVSDLRKKFMEFKDIENIRKDIKKNLKKDKIIISLSIIYEDKNKEESGHQNVIIIDNVNKIIENFEPHGQIKDEYPKNIVKILINTTYGILEYLSSVVEEYTDTKYTIFNNYITTCPLIGLQLKQEEEYVRAIRHFKDSILSIKDENFRDFLLSSGTGYCQIWGLYYIEKRLQNKYRNIKTEYQRQKMIEQLIKDIKKDKSLSTMIHKYAQKIRRIARKINKFKKEKKIDSKSKSSSRYLSDSKSGLSSIEDLISS